MNASLSKPAIELKGLTKTYGTGALAFQALKGIDLTVPEGEFMMLVGPSGSGKTTLLSILGCVLTPTSGEARLFDERINGRRESELPDLRLSYIGFIFQGHNLLPALSLEDNVAFPLELRGKTRGEALKEAREVLSSVGLADKMKRRPEDLSGGQRQRVAIARALAGRPPLILADEPIASLDPSAAKIIMDTLKDINLRSQVPLEKRLEYRRRKFKIQN
jgi:putative ABC transport system ATP-binding protein